MELARFQQRRDAVAHQLACDQKLVTYNQRLITAIQTDPVLSARYMLRHGNVKPTDVKLMPVPPSRADSSAPARILREATNPPPPKKDVLLQAGKWLEDPATMGSIFLMGLGLIAVAIVFFTPGPRNRG
jgi:hypothetical protein